ncbi:MAG: PIN domain-containing protein [Candidatus Schekmanbacteria bacterium]|nr:PIN domain-containing protein [Candidatus Schekmanbacteria bacterium]
MLEKLVTNREGTLTSQSLSEYFAVVTRKLSPPIAPEMARRNLEQLCRIWPVRPLTPAVVLEAVRGVIHHKLSSWDARGWSVAMLHGVAEVLSEDFTAAQVIEGVRFRNPCSEL